MLIVLLRLREGPRRAKRPEHHEYGTNLPLKHENPFPIQNTHSLLDVLAACLRFMWETLWCSQ